MVSVPSGAAAAEPAVASQSTTAAIRTRRMGASHSYPTEAPDLTALRAEGSGHRRGSADVVALVELDLLGGAVDDREHAIRPRHHGGGRHVDGRGVDARGAGEDRGGDRVTAEQDV